MIFLFLCLSSQDDSLWVHPCVSGQLLSCVWFFVTPQTVAHQASLSMRFSRQEPWSGLSFLPPGDLPDPGIEPTSPALRWWILHHWDTCEVPLNPRVSNVKRRELRAGELLSHLVGIRGGDRWAGQDWVDTSLFYSFRNIHPSPTSRSSVEGQGLFPAPLASSLQNPSLEKLWPPSE